MNMGRDVVHCWHVVNFYLRFSLRPGSGMVLLTISASCSACVAATSGSEHYKNSCIGVKLCMFPCPAGRMTILGSPGSIKAIGGKIGRVGTLTPTGPFYF